MDVIADYSTMSQDIEKDENGPRRASEADDNDDDPLVIDEDKPNGKLKPPNNIIPALLGWDLGCITQCFLRL